MIDQRETSRKPSIFSLIPEILGNINLFTHNELEHLNVIQSKFIKNVSQLSELGYKKEFERFAIDLSLEIFTDRRKYILLC